MEPKFQTSLEQEDKRRKSNTETIKEFTTVLSLEMLEIANYGERRIE